MQGGECGALPDTQVAQANMAPAPP